MDDTTALLRSFHRLAARIFNADFLALIDGAEGDGCPDSDVDACVRRISGFVYSPSRLPAFLRSEDPRLLSAIYRRYRLLDPLLCSGRLHVTFLQVRTDGELLRAFLVDLWAALPPGLISV